MRFSGKLKVLLIGDSYGLPRFHHKENKVVLFYEETYPERLREMLVTEYAGDVVLVNRCRHANTTHSLISGEANEIFFLQPQVTIIQLGLTDLWPAGRRNVLPLQSELMGRDPWVSAGDYIGNIEKFAACATEQGSRVILVGIPRVSEAVKKREPSVAIRTDEYTRLSREFADKSATVTFLDWRGIMEDYSENELIGEDGIHPTAFASGKLAEALLKTVRHEICEKGVCL